MVDKSDDPQYQVSSEGWAEKEGEKNTDDDKQQTQEIEVDKSSTEWKSARRVRMIALVLAILSLLPWLGLVMMSPMLFDAPGATESATMNMAAIFILSYPLWIIFGRSRSSYFLNHQSPRRNFRNGCSG